MGILPADFVEMLASLPGHEGAAAALSDTPSPVAVRLNPAKKLPGISAAAQRRIPWEPEGIYLSQRPQFTFHPGLYDGRFYVQDPSAMIAGEVIRRLHPASPVLYLDACAAPGGKTTSALANLPARSLVVANEFERSRASALIENVERWGADSDVIVTNGDACKLHRLGPMFDIVAADVPCSGEGMMRKNDTAVSQWSRHLIDSCGDLQRRIVESVWQTLRPGGYLIYSTCTFNTVENEGNANWIRDSLGAIPVDLRLAELPGVLPGVDTDIPCARFVPGRVDGEGQFVAVFRKPGDDSNELTVKLKQRSVSPKSKERQPDTAGWLDSELSVFEGKDGELYALLPHHLPLLDHIKKHSNVMMPGLHVASRKGRDLMPAQALATSARLKADAFPRVEVDYPNAIEYLRGQAIRLPEDAQRGYVLISTDGCNLGWAKNIGTRANNLLPKSRRIISGNVPAECPVLT